MYSCPHCSKNVKNLNKHIKRMHPDQVKKEPAPEPKTKLKTLELEIPQVKKGNQEKEEPEASGYHCVDCGYSPISKGQSNCPTCGARLDWSQV